MVYPPGASLARRQMSDFEFVWILEGASIAYFDGHRIDAPPDTILLRRPGVADRYEWARAHRTVHAYFHFTATIPPEGWPSQSAWPLAHRLAQDDLLRPLFRFVLSGQTLAESWRLLLLPGAIDLLLRSFVSGRFVLAAEPLVQLPEPVEKAMAFIRRTTFYERPRSIRLAQLARVAHVSPEYLCRLFRRSLDLRPRDCVRLARLEFAASLLAGTTMNIKQVSDAAGFANPYHFSRVFKQTYALSPSNYRRRLREGEPVPPNPIVRNLRLDLAAGPPVPA